MANTNQILEVFAKAESRVRIELMVLMCRLLTPTELRFMLTCLEDLAANSLRAYQKVESEANDCKRLSSINKPEATLGELVGQAVLFTSFLKKDNINGARIMTRILDEVMQRVELIRRPPNIEFGAKETSDFELPLLSDMLFLFSMASHHSAFSYNSRLRLHKYLGRLQMIFNLPEMRLSLGQSMGGSSMFSSLESVELGSECGTLPSTTSSSNQTEASSESSENNQNSEKNIEVNIPYHVVVSPRNDVTSGSHPPKVTVNVAQVIKEAHARPPSSQNMEILNSESTRERSCVQQSSPVELAPNSHDRVTCLESSNLVTACDKQKQPINPHVKPSDTNANCNVDDVIKDNITCQRPVDLWPSITTNCISDSLSLGESLNPGVRKPQQISAKSLLDKLISSNILNDTDVEYAKEKRRSLGSNGNQKALVQINCPDSTSNDTAITSTPIHDINNKFVTPLDSTNLEINDSCQIEGELSRSFLPDLLDFKDEITTNKPTSDRRSSMPPYLPSSLMTMFKEEDEKNWKEESTPAEDDKQNQDLHPRAQICVDDKNSDGTSSTSDKGSFQDKSESPIGTAISEAGTSNSSSKSYRNNRNQFGHSRNRNGNHFGMAAGHKGMTDYHRQQQNGGGNHTDSNGHATRNGYFKNNNGRTGYAEHKISRQSHFNWNGNATQFQQNRLQQLNAGIFQVQAQQKATFHQQFHQTYLNGQQQQQQSQMHNPPQHLQQQSKPSCSPPGAFNMQHLNLATPVTQQFYTHYLAHYPAEFAQAVLNPSSFYGFRAGLPTQAAVMNRNGNGVVYPNNGHNAIRGHPSSISRGVTPSYFAHGTPLVMATFQPNNGIQPLICTEQLNTQAPQTCYFDPTVPPPTLANPTTNEGYSPQIVLCDRGMAVAADVNGKLMCPNCASNDHTFNNCPHSLPAIPR